MQNLFRPSKSATLPFIGMADQANAGTSSTKRQENFVQYGDDYAHLMEMVRQRVHDEHGAQTVDVQ
jgi:hypothetical protein